MSTADPVCPRRRLPWEQRSPVLLLFCVFLAWRAPAQPLFLHSGQYLMSSTKGNSGQAVALGDVDGDGDVDAFVAQGGSNRERGNVLWLNNGEGQFSESSQDLGVHDSRDVGLADLDGDGDLDAFVANGGVNIARDDEVWINQGGHQGGMAGVFVLGQSIDNGASGVVALADFDGDEDIDAIVRGGPLTIWWNDGDARFSRGPQFVASCDTLAVGDLDGDGGPDLFVGRQALFGPSLVFWNEWNSSGSFQEAEILPCEGGPTGIGLADLDGDSIVDIFVATSAANEVWWNGGARSFIAGIPIGSERDAAVALGDLDRDGDTDAFVARRSVLGSTSQNGVWLNNGDRTFTASEDQLGGSASYDVALADLDGDHDLDAFVANDGGNSVWVNQTALVVPTIPEYLIDTVAGNGEVLSSGDGGLATDAGLGLVDGIAVDSQGNLFIAASAARRVRRVGPDGIIRAFAGNGTRGEGGDGGPAEEAELIWPEDVAVDSSGNVYIADSGSDRIRKVDDQGIITTYAGTGQPGFAGDGGPATAAMLDGPDRLAVSGQGELFIFDSQNHRIRAVDASGIIRTIAGNGQSGPSGDDGPAVDAGLGTVGGMAVDRSGNVYLSDATGHRIRRVDAGGTISTFAGTGIEGYLGDGGPASQARFAYPQGIAVDASGDVFVLDRSPSRVRRIDADGIIATIAGNGNLGFGGDGGPALQASLLDLGPLALDAAGQLYVGSLDRVRILTLSGGTQPLESAFQSIPPPGSTIDFGSFADESRDALRENTAAVLLWRRIDLGNVGLADLTILDVRFRNSPGPFQMELQEDGASVGLPIAIRPGYVPFGNEFSIKVTCPLDQFGVFQNVIQVLTDDPDYPLAEYTVKATARQEHSESAIEVILFQLLYALHAEGSSVAKAGLSRHSIPGTAEFRADTNSLRQLTSEVPAFLGGGSIVQSNFTGGVTVGLEPIPNDHQRYRLTVLSGRFEAESSVLPVGLATGSNVLTFGDPTFSGGVFDAETGEFEAYADAQIVNDLFPEGIQVRGRYHGTYDFDSGSATVASQSTDCFALGDHLSILRSANGAYLGWLMEGVLQKATEVLGPWTDLMEAVSPFEVVPQDEPEQYFRIQQPPGPGDTP